MNPYTRFGYRDDEEETRLRSYGTKDTGKVKRRNPYTSFGYGEDTLDIAARGEVLKDREQKKQEGGGFDLGKVVGAVGQALTDAYKRTGEGIAEVAAEATGVRADERRIAEEQNQQDIKLIRKYGDLIRNGSASQKKAAKQALASLLKQSEATREDIVKQQDNIRERVDPVKGAAAVGEIGLDVASLGTASTLLKGGKVSRAAGKLIAPSTIKQGAASGAAFGSAYGTLGTAQNKGADASIADYATGAIVGGAVGGALGAGVLSIAPLFRKITDGNVSSSRVNRQLNELEKSADLTEFAKKQLRTAIEERGRYSQSLTQRVTDNVRRNTAGVTNYFARHDRRYAKAIGKTEEQLIADGKSLRNMALQTRYYSQIADQMVKAKQKTGKSVYDVLQHYPEGSVKAQEFVNYLNNKRTVEYYNKFKKNLQPEFGITAIRKEVKGFEKKNSNALTDARTIKQLFDNQIDFAIDSKIYSKAEGQKIKDAYEFYSPLVRATPEDVVRPTITGGAPTNVGRGPVEQIKGGSQPYDVSLSGLIDKNNEFIQKSLKNRFDNELLTRYEQGYLGGRLLVDPEVVQKGKDLRELQKTLVAAGKDLSKAGKAGKEASKAAKTALKLSEAEKKALRQKAIAGVRDMLRKVQRIPEKPGQTQAFGDIAKFADSISDKQAYALFDVMTNYNPKKLEKVFGQLERKNSKIGALQDTIEEIGIRNAEIADLSKANRVDRAEVFNQLLEVTEDTSRGLNVVSGFRNGNKFRLEVDPAVAKALQALGPKQKLDVLSKGLQIPANIAKFVYTGPGAPVFATYQLVRNTGVMFTNSKNLSPFGARAIASFFVPDNISSKFAPSMADLQRAGASPEIWTQTVNDSVQAAGQYAARGLKNTSGKAQFFKNHPVLATKDFFRNMNRYGAFLNNQQRKQVATGAYLNAKNRGFNDEQATRIAADAYNEVLGNLNNASRLAQMAEPLVLYSGATQQGLRALFKAFRDRPVETTAKLTALSAPLAGFAYYNMSSQAGRDYFQDMYDNGKAYQVDNFITFVSPEARRNKDGRWEGVWRLPLTPDFRPLNKAMNEQIYGIASDEGIDANRLATAGFNFATGGILQNSERTSNIDLGYVGSQIPLAQFGGAIYNYDVSRGEAIPREDTEWTSEGAKALAGFFNTFGITATGNQIDVALQQAGMVGRLAQGRDAVGETLVQSLANNLRGPYASTKSISTNINSLIEAQKKARTALGQTEDGYERAKIKAEFNLQVEEFQEYIMENQRIRKLTDGQRNLLEAIRLR